MTGFFSALDRAAEKVADAIKGRDDYDARESKYSRGRPRTGIMMMRERAQQAEMNQMRTTMMMSSEHKRGRPPMHHPPARIVNPNSQLQLRYVDGAYVSGASGVAGLNVNRLIVSPDQGGGFNTYEHDPKVYNVHMHLYLQGNNIGALNLSNKEKFRRPASSTSSQ